MVGTGASEKVAPRSVVAVPLVRDEAKAVAGPGLDELTSKRAQRLKPVSATHDDKESGSNRGGRVESNAVRPKRSVRR